MLPLRSAAANQFSWQSKIDNLKSKIVEAPLAQLAEQLTLNQRVAGSIPARCTFFKLLQSSNLCCRILNHFACRFFYLATSWPVIRSM
jgi:hypothetical protein